MCQNENKNSKIGNFKKFNNIFKSKRIQKSEIFRNVKFGTTQKSILLRKI